MNAIKIVAAFGMEQTELDNYSHHLEPARKAALKSAFGAGTATSMTIFMMYSMYSYAFFVGSKFV